MDNTTTRPTLATITEKDIQDGKMMAILAYIIFLIPLLTSRENKYAMFHTEQAIILLITWVVIYIGFTILTIILNQISALACGIGIINLIVWIGFVVLWIIGIINAAGGKLKELPVIGQYGSKLNLVK
jgi:uncharacterized membrane protein